MMMSDPTDDVSFGIGDGLLGILQDLAAERTARHGR